MRIMKLQDEDNYRKSFPKKEEYKYRESVLKVLRGNKDLLASLRDVVPDYDQYYKANRYGGGKRKTVTLDSEEEQGNRPLVLEDDHPPANAGPATQMESVDAAAAPPRRKRRKQR